MENLVWAHSLDRKSWTAVEGVYGAAIAAGIRAYGKGFYVTTARRLADGTLCTKGYAPHTVHTTPSSPKPTRRRLGFRGLAIREKKPRV